MEKWVKIKGFKYYEVSNLGNVRSIKRKYNPKTKKLKTFINKGGYLFCYPYSKGVKHTLLVHRVVSIAFIPNPKNKPCVNHINGIKHDNRVENLEWCTKSENTQHAYTTGLLKDKKGENNGRAKLTIIQVNEIRNNVNLKNKELAIKYNIHQSYVSSIKNGNVWHL